MRSSTATFLFCTLAISGGAAQTLVGDITTGKLGNATAVTDNPSGAQYMATLPETAFDKTAFPNGGNVKGSVQAVSMPDGHGVMFHVAFSNLPSTGGPFIYHIHDQPVPSDGNCNETLMHLDPFQRGETPACDAALPATCQVGDLSGKHGSVNATPAGTFTATFTDDFASTRPGLGAFLGNRSIVLHFANTTRITCANFEAVGSSCGGGSGESPSSSSSSSRSTITSSTATGAETPSSSSSSRATTTTTTTTQGPTTRPTGAPTNTTGTTSRATRTTTGSPTTSTRPVVVTAAANAHVPLGGFAAGAAALAFFL